MTQALATSAWYGTTMAPFQLIKLTFKIQNKSSS
jgi:hypothetical protein